VSLNAALQDSTGLDPPANCDQNAGIGMVLNSSGCCSPAQGETEIQSCSRCVEALVLKWKAASRACQAVRKVVTTPYSTVINSTPTSNFTRPMQ
jgi:hypothetical protein